MNKKKNKLRLSKATLRNLNPTQMDRAGGGAAQATASCQASALSLILTATIGMSAQYCTSGDKCVTDTYDDPDPTAAENGCKRGPTKGVCSNNLI